jgi:MoxR-like ATPase
MNEDSIFQVYSGEGKTISDRGLQSPLFEQIAELDNPANYVADKGLRDAVNVAIALGQPLFITGEPGTGKTQLASSIAYELNLSEPLIFNTKTTSTAKSLFYRYDALRHFHDSQFRKEEVSVESYISYEALGLAILLSMDLDNPQRRQVNAQLPVAHRHKSRVRSVVLIDEIDKAPRDLPNDVLNEIETLSFTVQETGRSFSAEQSYRPIIIFTSNSEKNLPQAFLRRCIFYHISFPDTHTLKQIVQQRLKLNPDFTSEMVDKAIQHFVKIRELALKKQPATAELLAWIRILDRMHLDVENLQPGQLETLAFSYSILAKSKEDRETLNRGLIERSRNIDE